MAQKVTVELVDDLDGSSAAETVELWCDGEGVEVDLSEEHLALLRDGLHPFFEAGRPIPAAAKRKGSSRRQSSAAGGRAAKGQPKGQAKATVTPIAFSAPDDKGNKAGQGASTRTNGAAVATPVRTEEMDREQRDAVREWARAHGYEIGDRGRIAQPIINDYHASNS